MEVLHQGQSETEMVIQASLLSGRGCSSRYGRQPSAPREEWWPSSSSRVSSTSVLAGIPFGPRVNGGCFKGSGSALGFLWFGGARRRSGWFNSLAKPNKSLQLDAGFAGAAEHRR